MTSLRVITAKISDLRGVTPLLLLLRYGGRPGATSLLMAPPAVPSPDSTPVFKLSSSYQMTSVVVPVILDLMVLANKYWCAVL